MEELLTMRNFERSATHFTSGMTGGISSVFFGFPFDTIKVRQQTIRKSQIGLLQCYKEIVKFHGYQGLFQGMSYPIMAVGITTSLFFGFYGTTMHYIHKFRLWTGDTDISADRPRYVDMVLAGSFAGILQAIPATPIELVKTKLQVQRALISSSQFEIYHGPTDCIRKIHRKHGIRALFKGLKSTVIRDSISFGFYIYTFEVLCDLLTKDSNKRSIYVELFCGGVAGMVSWFNMPLDMIKSRIQADHFVNPRYPTYLSCFHHIYNDGGVKALYRGFPVTLIRAFPTNAITILVYTRVQKQLVSHFQLNDE